ncbi:MAG: precorrin-2 C(20)-methyltransferase [Desulfovibrio sp.]|jgi:precorrin-2/cobalt-factor-2 C20-methyltransferase|nr:precorrin-2 C(20)-methyltransferase [Desulfovibrio sp.]
MTQKVYLLGIGPGDPELLTIKAAAVLRQADIVFVPQSNAEGRSVAETIVAPYVESSRLRFVMVPMTRDAAKLDAVYENAADVLAGHVRAGRSVACVTLGDAMFYSTAEHVGARLKQRGVTVEYLAGIPSFVEAANRFGIRLAAGEENVVVAAMPESVDAVDALARAHTTIVLVKINKRLPVLLDYVTVHRPHTASLACRLGLPGEKLIDLAACAAPNDTIGYLSLAVIREKE